MHYPEPQGLSAAPGVWRWEDRGKRGWWRVHDALRIEDGPHRAPTPFGSRERALDECQHERDWPNEEESHAV